MTSILLGPSQPVYTMVGGDRMEEASPQSISPRCRSSPKDMSEDCPNSPRLMIDEGDHPSPVTTPLSPPWAQEDSPQSHQSSTPSHQSSTPSPVQPGQASFLGHHFTGPRDLSTMSTGHLSTGNLSTGPRDLSTGYLSTGPTDLSTGHLFTGPLSAEHRQTSVQPIVIGPIPTSSLPKEMTMGPSLVLNIKPERLEHESKPGESNISKLESLVNNLLKTKTEALSLPLPDSIVDSKPDIQGGFSMEKIMAKSPVTTPTERRKVARPRKTKDHPKRRSPPLTTPLTTPQQVPQMPASPMMFPGMPPHMMGYGFPMSPMSFPFGMPMPQMAGLPAQMAGLPAQMAGLPAQMAGLPGMSPFMPWPSPMGMPPFLPPGMAGMQGMPGMPGYPAMPQPKKSLPKKTSPVLKRDAGSAPDSLISGSGEIPLDLSGPKRRKTGDSTEVSPKSPAQQRPLSLKSPSQALKSPSWGGDTPLDLVVKRETPSPVSSMPATRPLQVQIPVSTRSELSPASVITPPKVGVLPRTGSSAFSSYSARSPATLSPTEPSKHSPGDTTSQLRVKETSVYEHKVLQTDLLEASQKEDPGSAVHKVHQAYRREVDATETERYKALSMYGKDDKQKEMLGSYFDHQRLTLARHFRGMLTAEKQLRLTQAKPTFPSPPGMPGMVPQYPFFNMAQGHLDSNRVLGESGRMNTDHSSEKAVTSPMSGENTSYMDSSYEGSDASLNEGDEYQRRRKFLSAYAVKVLNDWYETHYDHPYPDDQAVDELAERAQIQTSQVKKWMANKRVRSCNTLAFNGSIHPKKLQKLLQLKEAAQDPSSPSAVSENLSPNSSYDSPGSADKKRSKRLLDPAAVEFMNKWYFDHISYPYPNEEEKKHISEQTDLAIAQVTCWFANKRNRSNNTRKITTKQMWQKLNKKLEIFENIQRSKSDLPTMVPMSLPGSQDPTQSVNMVLNSIAPRLNTSNS